MKSRRRILDPRADQAAYREGGSRGTGRPHVLLHRMSLEVPKAVLRDRSGFSAGRTSRVAHSAERDGWIVNVALTSR